MKRAMLQITLCMVLLNSSLVMGKAISDKTKSNSLHSKSVEIPKMLEVQYDDYPVR